MDQNTGTDRSQRRKHSILMAIWVGLFCTTYFLFLPIKGDRFSHFLPVYIYLLLSFVEVWAAVLFGKLSRQFAVKLSIVVVSVAVLFPIGSYYYNGRLRYVQNAAKYGYERILWATLDTSNPDEIDFAAEWAERGGKIELVDKLIGITARPGSCARSHYDGDIDEECYKLQKELDQAARKGDLVGMRKALANGANVNAGWGDKFSPLYGAAARGRMEAIVLLLDRGADPNKVYTFGTTPLKIATYNNEKDVVKILLNRGADVCLTGLDDDLKMVYALDIAREESHREIEDMLIDAGARNCPGAFFK